VRVTVVTDSPCRDNASMTHQELSNSKSIVVFPTLADAMSSGFEPFDYSPDGLIVRTRTNKGWALGLVRKGTL